MSRYMPARIVNQEPARQAKRIVEGLKSGFYIKYPDLEKGPHVIKASMYAAIQAIELEAAKLETKQEDPA